MLATKSVFFLLNSKHNVAKTVMKSYSNPSDVFLLFNLQSLDISNA